MSDAENGPIPGIRRRPRHRLLRIGAPDLLGGEPALGRRPGHAVEPLDLHRRHALERGDGQQLLRGGEGRHRDARHLDRQAVLAGEAIPHRGRLPRVPPQRQHAPRRGLVGRVEQRRPQPRRGGEHPGHDRIPGGDRLVAPRIDVERQHARGLRRHLRDRRRARPDDLPVHPALVLGDGHAHLVRRDRRRRTRGASCRRTPRRAADRSRTRRSRAGRTRRWDGA